MSRSCKPGLVAFTPPFLTLLEFCCFLQPYQNKAMTESRLTALSDELYEGIASFLRYKDHVRASMTCRQLQDAYWSIQRRLTVLKAKNVTSRRRRTGYFNQLKACGKHLRVLHLVNFSSSCKLTRGRHSTIVYHVAASDVMIVCVRITAAIFNQIESLTGLRELDLSGNGIGGECRKSPAGC